MTEPYEEMSLEELVTYGPPTVQLQEDDPELYAEADEFMDGTFTQHDEEWYPAFRDTVESYLGDETSLAAVQESYAQVPVQNYSLEEREQLQEMIGADLHEQTITWHNEVMDRLDISKWTFLTRKLEGTVKDRLFS